MFYKVVGLMSGTSLDGLDIACVDFWEENNSWSFRLTHATTIEFQFDLLSKLENVRNHTAWELTLLDLELGSFFGKSVSAFLESNHIDKSSIHLIASHGHTVFHQPQNRVTLQIGKGQEIARITGIQTVNNFREKDVLYGGQGAPLVPIGDRDLFAKTDQFDALINLGGFANITILKDHKINAFDICPCNLVLNKYSKILGFPFDKDGAFGKQSKSQNSDLLSRLNALPHFKMNQPKSLGAEWIEAEFYPILDSHNSSAQDKIGVCYEVISDQIAAVLEQEEIRNVLVSGGGAKNKHLIELIEKKCSAKITVPSKDIIDFKEAIIFAYLGVLFMENKPNCLSEVTHASQDLVGGVLYRP